MNRDASRTYRCADCHEQTPHAYRLCDTCRADRATASRLAQGLPPTIESTYVLGLIVDILDAADREDHAALLAGLSAEEAR